MPHYTIIVLSNPVAGREAEYDAWYTNTHIVDLLKVPGVKTAQRFKLMGDFTQNCPQQYIAQYGVETDDLPAMMAEIQKRLGTDAMPMTEAFDMGSAAFLVAEAVTEKLQTKLAQAAE
ncbi:hypothetical protein [Zavarzinia sp. CC-PAN008]|uniref:hypothetical protein n=1 Tax=Zavarzinia sp. CC-PAN008 TaxID=3243332 RepID=UPI003F7468CC